MGSRPIKDPLRWVTVILTSTQAKGPPWITCRSSYSLVTISWGPWVCWFCGKVSFFHFGSSCRYQVSRILPSSLCSSLPMCSISVPRMHLCGCCELYMITGIIAVVQEPQEGIGWPPLCLYARGQFSANPTPDDREKHHPSASLNHPCAVHCSETEHRRTPDGTWSTCASASASLRYCPISPELRNPLICCHRAQVLSAQI